MSSVFSVDLGF